jgi:hypothetical protein
MVHIKQGPKQKESKASTNKYEARDSIINYTR